MKIRTLEVYGIIYKIINLINRKVYIGQTIQKNGFKDRYGNNLEKNTHSEYLRRSIHKYGIENFYIHEIFDVAFSKEELNIKEKIWIRYYDSTNKNKGYNISDGGSNGNNFAGKTEEEMNDIKELFSINGKKWWNGLTTEQKERFRDIQSNNRTNKIKIICMEDEKIFDSIDDCSREYNISRSHISEVCSNKRSQANDYHFMYYDDYLKLTKEDILYILNSNMYRKKIICLNDFKIFQSITECATFYSVFSANIHKVLKGKYKHTGGKQFMYYDEYIKQNKILIHNENLGQAI